MKCKKLVSLFLSLLLATALAVPACAAFEDVFADGSADGTRDGSLFLSGETVRSSAAVNGVLLAAGRTVGVNVVIGDGAKIGGRLHCNASALRSVPDGIADNAELYDEPESGDVNVNITVSEPSIGSIVLRKALSFAGVLLLAYVLLWLTPLWETVDRKYYGAPFGRYAKAFGIGFAVLAGVPLAAILLFISNVGVRLALIVLFLYAAAIIAAPVFLGFFLGALLWRGAMKKAPCYYAELAIGILVWRVAASVPGLSFAVGLVSVPLGLGVVTLLLGKGAAKPSPKAETACEECAASDPAALPEDSDSAEQ